MATIQTDVGSTTPWDIANKLAAQWANTQSADDAGIRRMREGDLDGSYDEDTTQQDALARLAAQQQGQLNLQHDSQAFQASQQDKLNDFTKQMAQQGLSVGGRRYGAAGGTANTSNSDAQAFMQGLMEGGITNPNAVAAYMGHAQQESGLDPTKVHDGGTGLGMLGWRDPSPGVGRKTALQAYAAANGLDPNSGYAQGRFAAAEATGEAAQYGSDERATIGGINNATNIPDAVSMLLRSERPDPTKANLPARLMYANQWANALGGGTGTKAPSVAMLKYQDAKSAAAANGPGSKDAYGGVLGPDGQIYTDGQGNQYRYVHLTDPFKLSGQDIQVDPHGPQAKNGALQYRWFLKRGNQPTVPVPNPVAQTANGATVPAPTAPAPVAQANVVPGQQEAVQGEQHNSYGDDS